MHLLVDISAHGLGHLAQTAPVIEALRRRRPGLRLTLRSGLSRDALAQRIPGRFDYLADAQDFGFLMRNAVDIDLPASAARYRAEHTDWNARVAAEAKTLRRLGVDAVLANAAYRPLAAAASAGLPGVGLCSLNWADLFHHFFGHEDWAPPIHRQMLAAYNAATVFLCVTPGMPMTAFTRRQRIGPIARVVATPPPARQERHVLVAMGGMEFRLPVETWPIRSGLVWYVPASWAVAREDIRPFAASGAAFTELLAGMDAVITKPGYGTFAEAACNGVPVLYLERPDWLETPHLAAWLAAYDRAREVRRERLLAGAIVEDLEALWAAPPPPCPAPTGAEEAAAWLERVLC